MATDIYTNYADVYNEKYTNRNHYEILRIPSISLAGAKFTRVRPEHKYRPDLICYSEYGTTEFEEILIIANKFTDPIKDFYSGREIVVPSFRECERALGI